MVVVTTSNIEGGAIKRYIDTVYFNIVEFNTRVDILSSAIHA